MYSERLEEKKRERVREVDKVVMREMNKKRSNNMRVRERERYIQIKRQIYRMTNR
jgi:hypothetical protein